MFFETRKFMLTVSLCAMLAVNPVLADAPKENESVGDSHTVYTQGTFEGRMDSGIAGVTYVNKAMDAAGNAAQAAEDHAAAAGASALSAAESAGKAAASAKDANDALSGKVDIEQGDENAYKVMVTDKDGTMYPGYVTSAMIEKHSVSTTEIQGPDQSVKPGSDWVLMGSGKNFTYWGKIGSNSLEDGAIYSGHIAGGAIHSGHIAGGAIHSGHIADGEVTSDHITSSGYTGVLYGDASGHTHWGQINSGHIADGVIGSSHIINGAVTAAKLAAGAVQKDKIAYGAIYSGHIADGAIYSGHIASGAVTLGSIGAGVYDRPMSSAGIDGAFLAWSQSGDIAQLKWRKIGAMDIRDGAVTIEKTDGVVGMVPVGSADATTYANFWIE